MKNLTALFERKGFVVREEKVSNDYSNLYVENDQYIGCFSNIYTCSFVGTLVEKSQYEEIKEEIDSKCQMTSVFKGLIWAAIAKTGLLGTDDVLISDIEEVLDSL